MPLPATLEELSLEGEECGRETLKELNKVILERGEWTSILFRFRVWRLDEDNASGRKYGPVQFSLRRYRKGPDGYRCQSKFSLTSREQARQFVDALARLLKET